jgi:hypothetical protein
MERQTRFNIVYLVFAALAMLLVQLEKETLAEADLAALRPRPVAESSAP